MSIWEFLTMLGGLSVGMKVLTAVCSGALVFCVLLAMPKDGGTSPKNTTDSATSSTGISASQTNRDNATGTQYNINTLNLNPVPSTSEKDQDYREQLSKFVAEGNSLHARLLSNRTDQDKADVQEWTNSVAVYLKINRPYLEPLFVANASSIKAYAKRTPEQSAMIVGLEIRMERLKEYILK